MEEKEQIEKKSYKPTDAMISNAKRGLEARRKAPKSQKGGFDAKEAKAAGVGSGVVRATNIINGSLSLESVKRMYSFLSRAKTYYKPNERTASGNLTPGTISYLLWAGPAGLAWSRSILRREGLLKSVEIADLEEVAEELGLQITKSTNQELMQATFVVMVPDEVDLHGDITSEEEVRKACHNYNVNCRQANLFHIAKTNSFDIVESYLAPVDMMLDDKFIQKGTWLCTVQCLDPKLFDLIKSGEINGVSIGAMAKVEIIEEDNE